MAGTKVKHRFATPIVLHEEIDRGSLQAAQHLDLHGNIAGSRVAIRLLWLEGSDHGAHLERKAAPPMHSMDVDVKVVVVTLTEL